MCVFPLRGAIFVKKFAFFPCAVQFFSNSASRPLAIADLRFCRRRMRFSLLVPRSRLLTACLGVQNQSGSREDAKSKKMRFDCKKIEVCFWMVPNPDSYPLAEKCAKKPGKIACCEVLACFFSMFNCIFLTPPAKKLRTQIRNQVDHELGPIYPPGSFSVARPCSHLVQKWRS